ncbi:hypothetical protein Tco_1049839, partial [Tanacetum coccineum]
MAGGVTPSPAT